MSIRTYIINATNVHITINDQWVDEAVSVVAQRQAQHQMVYGYMDVDPRRPTLGNAIVVGTIGIHHRSSDYLFKYLNNRPGFDNSRADALSQNREALRQFQDDAELLAYLATIDITTEEFDLLTKALEKDRTGDEQNDEEAALAPDVVGAEGFRKSIGLTHRHETLGRSYIGNTIKIYYGDAQEERFAEAIRGVIFTGEAMTPLENTAGVSADPLMKYFSFIAARIDPTTTRDRLRE